MSLLTKLSSRFSRVKAELQAELKKLCGLFCTFASKLKIMMQIVKPKAALFDLDGVIINSESQYSEFWDIISQKYYPNHPTFAIDIKGSTVGSIVRKYFGPAVSSMPPAEEIKAALDRYESQMDFEYFEGMPDFLKKLKAEKMKLALVTSSDQLKMANVYRIHPDLKGYFDLILTANDIHRSKPAPDCYLTAAEKLGVEPKDCVVFEDSHNGLLAGRNANMRVVGLVTTLSFEDVAALSDVAVPNLIDFHFAPDARC